MKQRAHITVGKGPYSIQKYPEIDRYIPEAVRIADIKFPQSNIDRRYTGEANEWSKCFHKAMDKLLKKAGLRK